jgi:hypothetical protein
VRIPETRPGSRQAAADVVALAGGAAVVGSAFLPWVAHGPGHSLHGHALADAVVALGNTMPGLSVARLMILWYLVPVVGALTWVAIGTRGRTSRSARIVAVAAVVVSASALAIFDVVGRWQNLGAGAFVAVAGAVVTCAATFAVGPDLGG